MLLIAHFGLDITVANDVAIDIAQCALAGKVMQGDCPEVHTLTNENWHYMIKLNGY